MKTLKKSHEYRRVIEGGKREILETIVVHRLPNQEEETRIGISVSRRLGNSVERNRTKRRIREAIRKNASFLPLGEDVVITPRGGFLGADFASIENDIRRIGENKDHA